MTEERKHAILFAATLLCARKLIETIESDKPNFAKQSSPYRSVGSLRPDGRRFREQIVSVVWRPQPMSAIRKEIRREA